MGRSKALLPFGGATLLERTVGRLAQAAGPIVVVAGPDQALPELGEDVTVARDPIAFRGPLQGLAVGLRLLAERGSELAYATAVDAPFLEPEWVERLVAESADTDLVIPRIRGQLHPLAALYRVDAVLDPIDGLLATDRLRLLDLMDLVRTRVLGEESFAAVDPELRTVHNLNSPAEYEAALDALARAEGT